MGRILCAGRTFDVTEDADVGTGDCSIAGEAGGCALVAAEGLGGDAGVALGGGGAGALSAAGVAGPGEEHDFLEAPLAVGIADVGADADGNGSARRVDVRKGGNGSVVGLRLRVAGGELPVEAAHADGGRGRAEGERNCLAVGPSGGIVEEDPGDHLQLVVGKRNSRRKGRL